jgi:hypothetical protein
MAVVANYVQVVLPIWHGLERRGLERRRREKGYQKEIPSYLTSHF